MTTKAMRKKLKQKARITYVVIDTSKRPNDLHAGIAVSVYDADKDVWVNPIPKGDYPDYRAVAVRDMTDFPLEVGNVVFKIQVIHTWPCWLN